MMSCKEVTDQVTDYLDGRVPHGKKIGMWLHLMMCVRCRTYVQQMRQVIVLAGELGGEAAAEPPPAMRESLLAEFRRRNAEGPVDKSDGVATEDKDREDTDGGGPQG